MSTPLKVNNSVVVTASADTAEANTDVTGSIAGVAGKTHYIMGIYASLSATGVALLTIDNGTDTLFSQYVYDKLAIEFNDVQLIPAGSGNDVNWTFKGAGSAIIGAVNVYVKTI